MSLSSLELSVKGSSEPQDVGSDWFPAWKEVEVSLAKPDGPWDRSLSPVSVA